MCGKSEDGRREKRIQQYHLWCSNDSRFAPCLINVLLDNVLAISVLIVFALAASWIYSNGGPGGQRQGKGYRVGLEHF